MKPAHRVHICGLLLATACQPPDTAMVSVPTPLVQALSADRLQNLRAVLTIKTGEEVVFTRTKRDISGDTFSIGFEGVDPGTYDLCIAFYGDSGSTTDLFLTSIGSGGVTLVAGEENRIGTSSGNWIYNCVERNIFAFAELDDFDGDGWSNLVEILRGLDPGSLWTQAYSGSGLRALNGRGSNNVFAISASDIIWMGEQAMDFEDSSFPTERVTPVPSVVPITPATGCATPTLLSLSSQGAFVGTGRGSLVGAGDGCVVAVDNEPDSTPTARLLQATNTAGTVDYTSAWTGVAGGSSRAALLSSMGEAYMVAETAETETVVIGDAAVATGVGALTVVDAGVDTGALLVTAHAGEVAYRSWPGSVNTVSCTFAWPALTPLLITPYRESFDATSEPVSVLLVFADAGQYYVQRLILAQPAEHISLCGAELASTSLALPENFIPTAMLAADNPAIAVQLYDEHTPCACEDCCPILLVGDQHGRVIGTRLEHGVGEPQGPWVELGNLEGGAVVGFADGDRDINGASPVFAATPTTVYRAP